MPQTVYLLILIVQNVGFLPDLLHAWRESGIPGATILHSTGMRRITNWLDRIGLGAVEHVVEASVSGQRTLLLAIQGEDLLNRAIHEAERILGDFDRQNAGILLVVPVAQVRGIQKTRSRSPEKPPPKPVLPGWTSQRNMPIEQVLPVLDLAPTMVPPDMSLVEVGKIMLQHANVHLACVVREDGKLLGLITLHDLVDDLFFRIMPEEFLSEITDMEEMMHFAQLTGVRTAEDAMQEPAWVKKDEPIKEAFKRMHDRRLPGLPVVDGNLRITGYINLLSLLFGSVQPQDEEGGSEGS